MHQQQRQDVIPARWRNLNRTNDGQLGHDRGFVDRDDLARDTHAALHETLEPRGERTDEGDLQHAWRLLRW